MKRESNIATGAGGGIKISRFSSDPAVKISPNQFTSTDEQQPWRIGSWSTMDTWRDGRIGILHRNAPEIGYSKRVGFCMGQGCIVKVIAIFA
jgi:hypothetical protein